MGKARTQTTTASLTLDAGALIALDRGDMRMVALLREALRSHVVFHVPAGVVGQAWRDGRLQVNVARFLRASQVKVHALDAELARACGELCGISGASDVIDASVVLLAREQKTIVLSSDSQDLLRLDPELEIENV